MKRANFFQTICYLAILVFAFPACTSVETLVESGNYEETIRLAQRRLTGKQKKNPKLVAAFEQAFNKVTARDMARARSLANEVTPNWGRVYDIYANIDRRQEAILPILPLVDKRGYQAEFRFAKVDNLLNEAASNAAAQLYADGQRTLTEGRQGNKAAAREAYNYFRKINKYTRNYRDSYALIREAEALGVVYISVEMVNNTGSFLPRGFESELLRVRTSNLDDKWRSYDFTKKPGFAYDYDARIMIEDIRVSPERVSERTYIDEREITDGEEYVLDENGNVAKDSLGNDITRPREVIVRADILEVYQNKTAIVSGALVLYDNLARRVVDEERLTAEAIFENYASTFRGDRRALSSQSRRRIGNQPLPFPSNESLILDAAGVLKPQLTERLAGSYRSLAR